MELDANREPNYEAYDVASLSLHEKIAQLFVTRNIPQVYEHIADSYQKYDLNKEELQQAGDIFNQYLLDAPQKLSLAYGKRNPSHRDPHAFTTTFITSVADELRTTYELWTTPDAQTLVTLSKSLVRVYDSPVEFKIGPFSSPAVIHETVVEKSPLDQNDFRALDELFNYLNQ